MKRSPSIHIKAAFLLIVFSLNTVVGFACSVGLEMGFNGSHHLEEKAAVTHKHDNSHQHDDVTADHQSDKTKDNCCKEEVIKFAKVDKLAPKFLDFSVNPVFFTAFFSAFNHFDVSTSYKLIPDSKYFFRTHQPPIPDIRIAIQSFQI